MKRGLFYFEVLEVCVGVGVFLQKVTSLEFISGGLTVKTPLHAGPVVG